jgi:hypothetical protein
MKLPDSEFLTIYRTIEDEFVVRGFNSQADRTVGDRIMALSIERFIELRLGSDVSERDWLWKLREEMLEDAHD